MTEATKPQKILDFVRSLEPLKTSVDFFTIFLLIAILYEFFIRQQIDAVNWLADLYKMVIPGFVSYYEVNRWTSGHPRDRKKIQRKNLIQGEYYVATWTVCTVLVLFLQVILKDFFINKPENLITITVIVWGAFILSDWSKNKFLTRKEIKEEVKKQIKGEEKEK